MVREQVLESVGRRVASQYSGPNRRILRDVDGPNATQAGDVAGANAGVCVTRSGHRNVESRRKFRLVVDPCDPMSVHAFAGRVTLDGSG